MNSPSGFRLPRSARWIVGSAGGVGLRDRTDTSARCSEFRQTVAPPFGGSTPDLKDQVDIERPDIVILCYRTGFSMSRGEGGYPALLIGSAPLPPPALRFGAGTFPPTGGPTRLNLRRGKWRIQTSREHSGGRKVPPPVDGEGGAPGTWDQLSGSRLPPSALRGSTRAFEGREGSRSAPLDRRPWASAPTPPATGGGRNGEVACRPRTSHGPVTSQSNRGAMGVPTARSIVGPPEGGKVPPPIGGGRGVLSTRYLVPGTKYRAGGAS